MVWNTVTPEVALTDQARSITVKTWGSDTGCPKPVYCVSVERVRCASLGFCLAFHSGIPLQALAGAETPFLALYAFVYLQASGTWEANPCAGGEGNQSFLASPLTLESRISV